jgi:hypothetical protein
VGLEGGPLSLVSTTEELLGKLENYKTENTALGIRHADDVAPSIRKFDTNLAIKRRSLSRYSSFEDSGHRVFFVFLSFF